MKIKSKLFWIKYFAVDYIELFVAYSLTKFRREQILRTAYIVGILDILAMIINNIF